MHTSCCSEHNFLRPGCVPMRLCACACSNIVGLVGIGAEDDSTDDQLRRTMFLVQVRCVCCLG